VDWAFIAAGGALAAYQAWAIRVRWVAARTLEPSERRVMVGVLVATRGLGLLLGLLLVGAGLARLG